MVDHRSVAGRSSNAGIQHR